MIRVRPGPALALSLCVAMAARADGLPRVASTNLCADLLLLDIADPGQIVSVSRQAQDPSVSPVAEVARRYPSNRGQVEDLLHLQPDLALVYQGWTGKGQAGLLAGRGIRLLPLAYPTSWAETLATTRQTAAMIGRAAAGEATVSAAERRMRSLAGVGHGRRALYLRPSGGTAGSGTYVDDVMRLLGLRNLASEQGIAGWGGYPLERLVQHPPDLFLLGYFDADPLLARAAYGRHPILRELLARIPGIQVPGSLWGCGGLELVAAAESIAGQLDRLPAP